MLPRRLFLASVMVLSLAAFAIAADRIAKDTKNKAEPQSRPGWFVVEENVWIRLNDEPSQHMHQAHESFLTKEYGATTNELRKAACYLHIAARNSFQPNESSTHCFCTRAGQFGGGRPGRHREIGQELRIQLWHAAEHALGRNDHTKAKAALNAKHHAMAGQYLRSAVNHVEDSAKWSGHELESGTVATANGVRIVAGKLIDGSGFVVDEAEKGVTWVGDEVEKVGKSIDLASSTSRSDRKSRRQLPKGETMSPHLFVSGTMFEIQRLKRNQIDRAFKACRSPYGCGFVAFDLFSRARCPREGIPCF